MQVGDESPVSRLLLYLTFLDSHKTVSKLHRKYERKSRILTKLQWTQHILVQRVGNLRYDWGQKVEVRRKENGRHKQLELCV